MGESIVVKSAKIINRKPIQLNFITGAIIRKVDDISVSISSIPCPTKKCNVAGLKDYYDTAILISNIIRNYKELLKTNMEEVKSSQKAIIDADLIAKRIMMFGKK